MFFVDDDQTQTGKFDLVRQKFVCAHHDIDRALVEPVDRLRGLSSAAEARQFRHRHGPIGKAILKGLGVLLSQKRCRTQNGHLFAAHHSRKGCTKRDFRFTETHVATHQAIHRTVASHVIEYGFNRRQLIGRFIKGEAFSKGFVVDFGEFKRVTQGLFTQSVKIEKFRSGVTHLFGGFLFRLLPIALA